ncbi:MAG: Fur family transcriptional regulator [Acidobacteriota bacterium]|nr:transcriptional repressor [Blastocatellia bacterium]MDW8411513.1 Fur family transcriptional regulator [Acidobacteriota bacterium]
MDFRQKALLVLKEQGFRITKQRRMVVNVLASVDSALSAHEIKQSLDAKGERIDLASIFRILNCLESNGLVHRLVSQAKVARCSLLNESNACHHFFVCDSCRQVYELTCSEPITTHLSQSGFSIKKHSLELTGLCRACGAIDE